jgi:hypothetical protein
VKRGIHFLYVVVSDDVVGVGCADMVKGAAQSINLACSTTTIRNDLKYSENIGAIQHTS